jgi:hypothetical protein
MYISLENKIKFSVILFQHCEQQIQKLNIKVRTKYLEVLINVGQA